MITIHYSPEVLKVHGFESWETGQRQRDGPESSVNTPE